MIKWNFEYFVIDCISLIRSKRKEEKKRIKAGKKMEERREGRNEEWKDGNDGPQSQSIEVYCVET